MIRRVSSCCLAEFVLFLQPGMEFFALGDVLVGRQAAAAGQRVDRVGNDPPAGEFLDRGVERDVRPTRTRT